MNAEDGMEDDGTGYLMSVSDMMAGLLFVFILALVAFIISFQSARDQITDAQDQRRSMLEDIETTLRDQYGIEVSVEPEHGILRIPNRAVSFPTAEATLSEAELTKIRTIGEVLAEVVSCYAAGDNVPPDCAPSKRAELDAALIEGHTDNIPIGPNARFQDNLELSTARAAHTYRNLVGFEPILGALVNAQGQPIFSVSGYGATRPVVEHDRPTDDPRNRRIDLRFLMAPPSSDGGANPVVEDLQREGLR